MKKVLFFFCLLMAVAIQSNAQIRTPQPSPSAKIMQSVGLTDVTVEYARPSMKGRTIFADNGLVPFGEIWRTGANSATKITLSTDATIAGAELNAGAYAILTKPAADAWTVMLFPYTTSNWGAYVEQTPAATVTAEVMNNATTVESFMISIDALSNNGAQLLMAWENTIAVLPIEVPAKAMAMASIERALSGPSAGDYYAAAAYYHSEGLDLKQAHEWVLKANANGATYWQLRLQSQIEADLEMYEEAIATAKQSLEKAKEAGNNDYIRMNEANIKAWSMKK